MSPDILKSQFKTKLLKNIVLCRIDVTCMLMLGYLASVRTLRLPLQVMMTADRRSELAVSLSTHGQMVDHYSLSLAVSIETLT